MAYAINDGAIAQVTFRGLLYGQQVMNSFHYRYNGPVIANGQTFMINLIQTNPQMQACHAVWQDAISADVVANTCLGQWIFPIRYRLFQAPMANATGNGGPANTGNTSSVITLVADRATRHGIGNKHLPGLPSASQDLGGLIPAQLASNGFFASAMETPIPILGGVMQPVIYNRAAPGTSLEVIGSELNPLVRVMRRRTVGLGK